MNKEAELEELNLVKSGDQDVLKRLYKRYRAPFIQWAQWRYAGTDAADIYQQAFTIFYFNVKEGKFNSISSMHTYLFAIGKNLLNKLVQSPSRTEPIEDMEDVELSPDIFENYEATHRQQVVSSILEKVGEPCKTILTRYYFDNFTMESIADIMGYKTAMVAKKKKCECLTKIRAVLRAKEIQMKGRE